MKIGGHFASPSGQRSTAKSKGLAYTSSVSETERLAEIERLYRQAFHIYGTIALWSYRKLDRPTPADALAITRALQAKGGMAGRRLAEQIEGLCHAVAWNRS
jgi:hypothetical protein